MILHPRKTFSNKLLPRRQRSESIVVDDLGMMILAADASQKSRSLTGKDTTITNTQRETFSMTSGLQMSTDRICLAKFGQKVNESVLKPPWNSYQKRKNNSLSMKRLLKG